MKNRLLLVLGIIVLSIVFSIIIPVNVKKWTYSLPNNYLVAKVSNNQIIIGKYFNKKLSTKKDNINIGVSEYVEAFATNNEYIFARCLNNKNDIVVDYYIIDSKNEKIYGSYELEGF